MPAVCDRVEDADDALSEWAVRDTHRVLCHLFPDRKTELKYNSRPRRRRHEFMLSQKFGKWTLGRL